MGCIKKFNRFLIYKNTFQPNIQTIKVVIKNFSQESCPSEFVVFTHSQESCPPNRGE